MKKNGQHIALLLLIFIAYPFVFQALHILYDEHGHSLDQSNGNSHICLSGGSCNGNKNSQYSSLPGFTFHAINPEKDSVATGNHCPLCEHDFAKFRISSIYQIAYSNEIFSLVYSNFYQVPRILFTGNHISLRAPPSLS